MPTLKNGVRLQSVLGSAAQWFMPLPNKHLGNSCLDISDFRFQRQGHSLSYSTVADEVGKWVTRVSLSFLYMTLLMPCGLWLWSVVYKSWFSESWSAQGLSWRTHHLCYSFPEGPLCCCPSLILLPKLPSLKVGIFTEWRRHTSHQSRSQYLLRDSTPSVPCWSLIYAVVRKYFRVLRKRNVSCLRTPLAGAGGRRRPLIHSTPKRTRKCIPPGGKYPSILWKTSVSPVYWVYP